MKITRNGKEFKLTQSELFEAYQEETIALIEQDIKEYIEEFLDIRDLTDSGMDKLVRAYSIYRGMGCPEEPSIALAVKDVLLNDKENV